MNRASLARYVAEHTDLGHQDAYEAVQAVMDGIVQGVKDGEDVTLSNFGTFSIRWYRARTCGRNPNTGQENVIPERMAFHFRPSQQIQLALRKGTGYVTARKAPKGRAS